MWSLNESLKGLSPIKTVEDLAINTKQLANELSSTHRQGIDWVISHVKNVCQWYCASKIDYPITCWKERCKVRKKAENTALIIDRFNNKKEHQEILEDYN